MKQPRNYSFALLAGLRISDLRPLLQTNSPVTAALAELTKPAKKIPFKEVILATTQHRILDFDTNNPAHVALLQKLSAAASAAADQGADRRLIFRPRQRSRQSHGAFRAKPRSQEAGLHARTPVTTAGEAQTVGYPDVEILGDPPCYLELKTYNATTVNTTQRSFYYSPSRTSQSHPRRAASAPRLRTGKNRARRQNGLHSRPLETHHLQDLEVDLKFEFNQSNRALYGPDNAAARLGEGTVK